MNSSEKLRSKVVMLASRPIGSEQNLGNNIFNDSTGFLLFLIIIRKKPPVLISGNTYICISGYTEFYITLNLDTDRYEFFLK